MNRLRPAYKSVYITIMTQALIQERKIKTLVEQSVSRIMRQILIDPDYGSELTAYAKRRLNKSLKFKKAGKTISLDEILSKYR